MATSAPFRYVPFIYAIVLTHSIVYFFVPLGCSYLSSLNKTAPLGPHTAFPEQRIASLRPANPERRIPGLRPAFPEQRIVGLRPAYPELRILGLRPAFAALGGVLCRVSHSVQRHQHW